MLKKTSEVTYLPKLIFTEAECKCHYFLPSFLYRRPFFGVQKRLPNNWREKLACHPFGVFLASFWRTKKVHDLLPSFFEFLTPKSHQKDGKKSRSLFCPPIWSATKNRQQKVAEVNLDGKRSPWWKGRQKVLALAFTLRSSIEWKSKRLIRALSKPLMLFGRKLLLLKIFVFF